MDGIPTGSKPTPLRVETLGAEALPTSHRIRRIVFVEGQGVPESHEIDGLDGDCVHFLAYLGDEAVGCARMRSYQGAAKAERVAVLSERRGAGIGRALMLELEARAVADGFDQIVLNAQTAVLDFYTQLGYTPVGATFEEAGIPHQGMTKGLPPR